MNKIEMRMQGLHILLQAYNDYVNQVEIGLFETSKYDNKFINSCSDKMLGMVQMLADLGLLKAGELCALYYVIDNFENHQYDSSQIERLLKE